MIFWLRPLLIIALTLFATPRVMAADGEYAVICAADGSRQIVLFDFETGAPVEKTVSFETCDHCLTPPMVPDLGTMIAPTRRDAQETAARPAQDAGKSLTTITASARGPPKG